MAPKHRTFKVMPYSSDINYKDENSVKANMQKMNLYECIAVDHEVMVSFMQYMAKIEKESQAKQAAKYAGQTIYYTNRRGNPNWSSRDCEKKICWKSLGNKTFVEEYYETSKYTFLLGNCGVRPTHGP